MLLQLVDNFVLDAKEMRKTRDGYMVSVPRVARTGIQDYAGFEVGRPDLDTVRVYRPPDEVFNKDSMATYVFKPITNDHPKTPVTAANWRDHTVGLAGGEVARDGDFIRVPMTVMDGKAIGDVDAGKKELSVGYSTELKWGAGVTPDTKEQYDAIQTQIVVNHIAIVDAARGGPKLRIGDRTAPETQTQTSDADDDEAGADEMSDAMKKVVSVMVDGISLEMGDTAAAVVSKALKDANDKLSSTTAQLTTVTTAADQLKKDSEAALAKAATEHAAVVATKDAEIATLKKQVEDGKLSPEKIEAMVKDRAELLGKAKAILGDKLVVKDMTDGQIRRQVVDATLKDTAKGWSDDQVKVSFDTIAAGVKINAGTGVQDTAHAFSNQGGGNHQPGNWGNDAKAQTYKKRDEELSNAWKNAGSAPAAKN